MNKIDIISVVFVASDGYAPYLATCLASILANANYDDNLSFYVLTNDFSETNQRRIEKLKQIKDFEIQYVNANYAQKYNLHDNYSPHITNEPSCRLCCASFFPGLDKAIILDANLVVLRSLKGLWNIDIEDYYMAAAVDPSLNANYNKQIEAWCRFSLPSSFQGVHAGVMLLNLKKWRDEGIEENLFQVAGKLCSNINCLDQDILNAALHSKILLLDLKWNASPQLLRQYAPRTIYDEVFSDPHIVHYAGGKQPWLPQFRVYPQSEYFWQYAKLTPEPFYASLLGGSIIASDVIFINGCVGPSHPYRVDNIAVGLEEMGYDVLVIMPDQAHRISYEFPPKVILVFRYDDSKGMLTPILSRLKKRGTKLVFDCDDLIFEPDVVNEIDCFRRLSQKQQLNYAAGVLGYMEMISQCDMATTSTSFLASRMRCLLDEVHVVPNSLSVSQVDLAENLLKTNKNVKNHNDLVIFYGSGTRTHQRDFDECATALARFMTERPMTKFVLVGPLDIPPVLRCVKDRIKCKPLLPILDLMAEIINADINLAPLENNAFNHSKSECKIFEAGIVCVPTIASTIESYNQCIDNGVAGILANTEEEWYEALCKLADDPVLRTEMGKNARKISLERFNYHKSAQKAAEAYGLLAPGLKANFLSQIPVKVTL